MASVSLTSLGAKMPPVSNLQAMSPRLGIVPWQQCPNIWQQWLHCHMKKCGKMFLAKSAGCLRFLNGKLTQHFAKKRITFKATYVTTVRDWSGNLMNYTTTFGAYRKRAKDEKEIPHSFTFVRRECPWTYYGFEMF